MRKYKFLLRIVTITLILLISFTRHAQAFDLDMTAEDDIRKNYNSSKLLKDTNTEELEPLPDLPEKLKNESPIKSTSNIAPTKVLTAGRVKIPKGTSFEVVNIGKISDWQRKGTVVKFKTTSPLHKRKYTIPASTVLMGEIIESHQPQITCNGGLVVIRIKSMVYKEQTIPLNAYVTRADGKIIFFNDIKGKRTYLQTVWKKGTWGRSILSRMMALTVKLGGEGSTILLSPFPFLYGTICFGANTLISPITAFFNKGGHVSINSGSSFRIKLLEDSFIEVCGKIQK